MNCPPAKTRIPGLWIAYLSSLLFIFLTVPNLVSAGNEQKAEKIIKEQLTICHRTTGEAKPRFELKAPDLMWAGVKFMRLWIIRWKTKNISSIIFNKKNPLKASALF
ncbi:MAG: hypothetical protein JSU88_04965 [Nitrospinaceae bacterium]|nr:MAG: hypothetical protein JSU88_04965 [Nitrospinaceae bacterium]